MDLVFDRSFDARHGEPVDVAPGIRRVTAANAGPFTFQGTNSYLIGGAELAVLDPGPEDLRHVESLLRAIGGARVVCILLSHSHRDHCGAAHLLQAQTGAPILAARPRQPGPSRGEDAAGDAAAIDPALPGGILAEGQIVEAGGIRLAAIATPGHAADHLAFAIVGGDMLFSGDHVMGWSTTVVAPPDGSMADYMASLDKLLARPEKVYLPGHGGPIRDAHSYVRGLRTHRRMREKAILERLGAGDRDISQIVKAIYPGLDPRLSAGAALSTLAHLQDLVDRELVFTSGEPRLGGRYWPAASPEG